MPRPPHSTQASSQLQVPAALLVQVIGKAWGEILAVFDSLLAKVKAAHVPDALTQVWGQVWGVGMGKVRLKTCALRWGSFRHRVEDVDAHWCGAWPCLLVWGMAVACFSSYWVSCTTPEPGGVGICNTSL
eukprot:362627-Chlamydomonas_euryale.AAC.6